MKRQLYGSEMLATRSRTGVLGLRGVVLDYMFVSPPKPTQIALHVDEAEYREDRTRALDDFTFQDVATDWTSCIFSTCRPVEQTRRAEQVLTQHVLQRSVDNGMADHAEKRTQTFRVANTVSCGAD